MFDGRASLALIEAIARSETEYMTDRMEAIRERPGNPEQVDIGRFGNAVCFYSGTMPWASFNTVKGLRGEDADLLEEIVDFYRSRARSPQFEIVPSLADQRLMKRLSELGFYQSGFHASMYAEAPPGDTSHETAIQIRELRADEFELYAAIHCRGTGLPDNGIPPVAANNQVLYGRPGWKFFVAEWDHMPAAVGVMHMKGEVASLTFAATLSEFRNRGLQQALLRRRIADAASNGCRLVVSQCAFLSQSQRNMERAGMRIGYVRASWTAIEN
ncbi:GNAT family N-acetyltransferase [Cohnella terricola]|uniref:GNAT family N-acetyltransferase n=1 Tax=Cohnella terricola TaxID=1289167 RepID=A0A559J642_9BACL|nr:GNAT family N-acetyltransferase [Cohnella terricola]TVX95321.1 GNAT family N-acetyltransferase [Cohnella terricola]